MSDPLFEDNIADLYDNTDEYDKSTGLNRKNRILAVTVSLTVLTLIAFVIVFAPLGWKLLAIVYLGVFGYFFSKGFRQGWRNAV